MDIQVLRQSIDAGVKNIGENLIEWRRYLHRNPELRFEERKTSKFIADLLTAIGLTTISVAQTGVVALLEGSRPGPTVALRADMDALPINDEKDVLYKSSIPGVCHACGHDVHMAVALGVVYVLSELKNQLKGNVKLIFQPAEEIPSGEQSGAKAMIKEGVLHNPDVSAIFGMHCWPELKVGKIGLQRGCTMASADSLAISVMGQAAHAGMPQNGHDSILTAAQVIQAMHMVSAREVSPNEAHTLSIGTIQGGQSQSIVCDWVEMTGTLRTTSSRVRNHLIERLSDVVRDVSIAHRCEGYLKVTDSFPPVINDSKLLDLAITTIRAGFGDDRIVELVDKPMTAEDFSYYLDHVPGLYIKIGVAPQDISIPSFSLHNPKFDIDENALMIGVSSLAMILLSVLDSSQQRTGD